MESPTVDGQPSNGESPSGLGDTLEGSSPVAPFPSQEAAEAPLMSMKNDSAPSLLPPPDAGPSEKDLEVTPDSLERSAVLSSTLTKVKLNQIMEDFVEFDKSMKIGTRQRREHDEHRINELHDELAQMERHLNAEIKRRMEINKSIQVWAETELLSITTRFENVLRLRLDGVEAKVVDLNKKLQNLEERFEYERKRIPEDIERKNVELTKQLHDFQKAFKAEKESRLAREGEILKRLADHEQEVAERFTTEKTDRAKQYGTVKTILEEAVKTKAKGDEKFHAFVSEEVANLKNQLTAESQTREREDDEIVEALNRYTAKLQESLKIINSTDM